jgi:hypothetical protein
MLMMIIINADNSNKFVDLRSEYLIYQAVPTVYNLTRSWLL